MESRKILRGRHSICYKKGMSNTGKSKKKLLGGLLVILSFATVAVFMVKFLLAGFPRIEDLTIAGWGLLAFHIVLGVTGLFLLGARTSTPQTQSSNDPNNHRSTPNVPPSCKNH